MKEIVVLSGKGGTGKTSIVASFASLAQSKVLADYVRNCAALGLLVILKLTHSPVKDVASATRFVLLMPSL